MSAAYIKVDLCTLTFIVYVNFEHHKDPTAGGCILSGKVSLGKVRIVVLLVKYELLLCVLLYLQRNGVNNYTIILWGLLSAHLHTCSF